MIKILTIIGARPQFVKAAVVSRIISSYKQKCIEIILHTGQHFDDNMSNIFFDDLDLPKPLYNLGIGGGSHGKNTGRMLEAIEDVIVKENPNIVLVYGDTDSTLAGALAATKLNIPIAHVEAGLRSFNKKMPEEINRILTDHCSSLLFTPTKIGFRNLRNEGICSKNIILSGDVMYDSSIYFKNKVTKPSNVKCDNNFVLATIHRAESTNDKDILKNIFSALTKISKIIPVIIPIHPRTRLAIKNYGIDVSAIQLIEPVGYFEILWLLQNCESVITDSGGLQKEAYFFKKKSLIVREETEWVEIVRCGWNELVGYDQENIYDSFLRNRNDIPQKHYNFFGKGNSGIIIVNSILNYFHK
jgi:UDP-GlcNAc3NAcA epimerase